MRWLRRTVDDAQQRLGLTARPVPREAVVMRPIAVVRNNVRAPRADGWEQVRSDLIFREELTPALYGIETYSHVIVVFHCHLVPDGERNALLIHPRGDPAMLIQGVLATRSQRRPNALGVSVVPLLRRRHNIARVLGLDAVDGTPVLDIKPYIPYYDSVPDARVPDWIGHPPPGAQHPS